MKFFRVWGAVVLALAFSIPPVALITTDIKKAAAEPAHRAPQMWTCFKAVTPTAWTGQTAYTANGTTPTLLIRKSGSGNRTTLKRLDISQTGTVAGGLITCVIKLDTSDRYSSAGNLWLIRSKDMNQAAASQPQFTMYDSATATSEAATDPRTIFSGTIFQTVSGLGTGFVYDFAQEDVITSTGSLLIYLYASTTGPTFQGTLTMVE